MCPSAEWTWDHQSCSWDAYLRCLLQIRHSALEWILGLRKSLRVHAGMSQQIRARGYTKLLSEGYQIPQNRIPHPKLLFVDQIVGVILNQNVYLKV